MRGALKAPRALPSPAELEWFKCNYISPAHRRCRGAQTYPARPASWCRLRSAENPRPMATKAIWNGVVIAATDNYEVVEGNVYFPPASLNMQYAKPSSTHTNCPWKGQASYYTLEVDGKENKDAAWFYPAPKPAAQNIKDYVAFWKGVKVEKAATA